MSPLDTQPGRLDRPVPPVYARADGKGRRMAASWRTIGKAICTIAGIVNLSERWREESASGRAWPRVAWGSGGNGHAGDLAPGGEAFGSRLAVGFGGQRWRRGRKCAAIG